MVPAELSMFYYNVSDLKISTPNESFHNLTYLFHFDQ